MGRLDRVLASGLRNDGADPGGRGVEPESDVVTDERTDRLGRLLGDATGGVLVGVEGGALKHGRQETARPVGLTADLQWPP